MKSPYKIIQPDDSLSMLYESGEQARNYEQNFDEADNDCLDFSDEDALLENNTSSNVLEMEYDEDDNAESCT